MNAYAFKAALHCERCAERIIDALRRTTGEPPLELRGDSDHWPQGPIAAGGGEADAPQHCDTCDLFLENPLTDEGRAYVREHLTTIRHATAEGKLYAGTVETIWADFYGIKADDVEV